MPFAMCISTGFVPQWYMKTPGSPATKLNENDWPGLTSLNAMFGAIRAAWKSIECGIAPPLVSVIFTVWPCRTWITGPGAPPEKAQALYLIPGATSWTTSFRVRWTTATGPAGAASSAAGYGLCAAASASAFSGARPA